MKILYRLIPLLFLLTVSIGSQAQTIPLSIATTPVSDNYSDCVIRLKQDDKTRSSSNKLVANKLLPGLYKLYIMQATDVFKSATGNTPICEITYGEEIVCYTWYEAGQYNLISDNAEPFVTDNYKEAMGKLLLILKERFPTHTP